jgi:hypothetical protein
MLINELRIAIILGLTSILHKHKYSKKVKIVRMRQPSTYKLRWW